MDSARVSRPRATWETRTKTRHFDYGASPMTRLVFSGSLYLFATAATFGRMTEKSHNPCAQRLPGITHASKVWPSSGFACHYSRNILSCGY